VSHVSYYAWLKASNSDIGCIDGCYRHWLARPSGILEPMDKGIVTGAVLGLLYGRDGGPGVALAGAMAGSMWTVVTQGLP